MCIRDRLYDELNSLSTEDPSADPEDWSSVSDDDSDADDGYRSGDYSDFDEEDLFPGLNLRL